MGGFTFWNLEPGNSFVPVFAGNSPLCLELPREHPLEENQHPLCQLSYAAVASYLARIGDAPPQFLEGEGLVVIHEGMPHVVVGLEFMGHAQGIQVVGQTVTVAAVDKIGSAPAANRRADALESPGVPRNATVERSHHPAPGHGWRTAPRNAPHTEFHHPHLG